MERCSFGAVEGLTAGAGVLGVGVIDREALTLNRVSEVDRGTAQVRHAHAVDDDLDAVERTNRVAIKRAIVEVQLVDQTGAPARLNGDTQAQVIATLLLEEALDLRGSDIGEDNLVGGSLSCGLGHDAPFRDE